MRTQLEKSLHISCYLFHSGIPPCLKHMRSNFISFFQSFSRNWDSVTSNYRKANRIKQNRTFVDTVTEKSRKYIFLLEWCANDGVMNSCISSSRSSPLPSSLSPILPSFPSFSFSFLISILSCELVRILRFLIVNPETPSNYLQMKLIWPWYYQLVTSWSLVSPWSGKWNTMWNILFNKYTTVCIKHLSYARHIPHVVAHQYLHLWYCCYNK